LSAEQVTIPFSPVSSRLSIQSAIFASHGQRSSSVSGMPSDIFSTFVAGCRESPSSNGQPSRSASSLPIVDFPAPDTPMITRTTGEVSAGTVIA